MQRMLTVDEAAAMLRHSKYTIRNWIKRGRLQATRVGQRYLIMEGAVQELVVPPAQTKIPREESKHLMEHLLAEGVRAGVTEDTYNHVMRDAEAREEAARFNTGAL
ncbi:MAG: helix-turn-helix domain-containing protein [Armatimonadota bacterium]